jgi:UDP-N-acetylmuramoylalanine--D-glutamate ligase
MKQFDLLDKGKLTLKAYWEGKRVVVIGAARQGTALTRFLVQHGAEVVLNDIRPSDQLGAARKTLNEMTTVEKTNIEWILGSHPIEILDGADLVCPSGGIPLSLPLVREAQQRGIPLSNDSQIFLEEARCTVIGITGSAGKTTTTSLVGSIARKAVEGKKEVRIWVGGNIGSPLIAYLDNMSEKDLAIMELSSFQLDVMTRSPQIAAVLNITPNHLNRHGTMAAYTAAKARIIKFQTEQDISVIGCEDPNAMALVEDVSGRLFTFGWDKPLSGEPGSYMKNEKLFYWDGRREIEIVGREEIKLRGDHNLLNVLAACAISAAAGLDVQAMCQGIQVYRGEPHRLEFVRSFKGADWYNDSIATAPERSIAAIRSFEEPLVLLAGGRDKDLPWDNFAALVRERVEHLILFGESKHKIHDFVMMEGNSGNLHTITFCKKLKEAVASAALIAEPGDVVLLSPGGTSFDEFRDFEERGEAYRKWVSELI